MRCPFLSGRYMFFCSAQREVYVPSRFEVDEYCRDMRYNICPWYDNARAEGKPHPRNEDMLVVR